MTKRGIVILLSAAALLIAVAWEIRAAVGRPKAEVGQRAPAFTAETIAGRKFSLSKLQKEPVRLDFFATWCGLCQQEMPALNRFAVKEDGKAKVVMIDRGDSKVMVQRFLKKYHVSNNITVLLNQPDKLSRMYQVSGQPEAIFVNSYQTVLYHTEGPLSDKQMLQWAREAGVNG